MAGAAMTSPTPPAPRTGEPEAVRHGPFLTLDGVLMLPDACGGWVSAETYDQLRAALTTAERERDALVRAIDEELVSSEIGTFSAGDDPKAALNKLAVWSQGVGAYFANEERDRLKAENAALREERGVAFPLYATAGGNTLTNCYEHRDVGCDEPVMWVRELVDAARAGAGDA